MEQLKEENKLAKTDNSKKDIEILNLQTIINDMKGTSTSNGSKGTKLEAPKQEPVNNAGKRKEKVQASSQEASQVEFSQPTNKNTRGKRKLDKVDSAEKENVISDSKHQASPPKKQKTEKETKQYIFAFSNKKDEDKQRYKEIITALGGTIVEETGKFDPRITHLLTVVGSSTVKTIGASLTHKWIIRQPDEWLAASKEKGHFVDEMPYGKRNTESIIKGKKICVVVSPHKASQAKNAAETIAEFGECTIVPTEQMNDADIVVIWEKEKPSKVPKDKTCLQWDDFLKIVHNES